MTGAKSRRKGHRYELDVVHYLQRSGYPEAATTRAALGHSGTVQPGDVVGPVGLAIECKSVAETSWPAWLRQAERQAGETLVPVVVRKTDGSRDVGEDVCILPYDDWLVRLDGHEILVTRPSTTCQADLWLGRHDAVVWSDRNGRRWAVVRFRALCHAARTSA